MSEIERPIETRTLLKADLDRLIEQVDQLAEGRIERNARIAALEAQLAGAVDDWKRVLEWARPTPLRTDEDRINALGEIFDIATRRLVGGQ